MKQSYRSPFTCETITRHQYMDEWDSIIIPLEEKFGLITLSFDPDLRVTHKDFKGRPDLFYNGAFKIPIWFAKNLLEIA